MKKTFTFCPMFFAEDLRQAETEARRWAASAEAWEKRVRSLLAGHGDDAVLGDDVADAVEQAAFSAADAAEWEAYGLQAAAKFGGDVGALRAYALRAQEAADRCHFMMSRAARQRLAALDAAAESTQ